MNDPLFWILFQLKGNFCSVLAAVCYSGGWLTELVGLDVGRYWRLWVAPADIWGRRCPWSMLGGRQPAVFRAAVPSRDAGSSHRSRGGGRGKGWRGEGRMAQPPPRKGDFSGPFLEVMNPFQGLTTSLWWTCTRTRRRSCRQRTSRSLTCWTTSGTSWSRRRRLKSTTLTASSSSPLSMGRRRSLLWEVKRKIIKPNNSLNGSLTTVATDLHIFCHLNIDSESQHPRKTIVWLHILLLCKSSFHATFSIDYDYIMVVRTQEIYLKQSFNSCWRDIFPLRWCFEHFLCPIPINSKHHTSIVVPCHDFDTVPTHGHAGALCGGGEIFWGILWSFADKILAVQKKRVRQTPVFLWWFCLFRIDSVKYLQESPKSSQLCSGASSYSNEIIDNQISFGNWWLKILIWQISTRTGWRLHPQTRSTTSSTSGDISSMRTRRLQRRGWLRSKSSRIRSRRMPKTFAVERTCTPRSLSTGWMLCRKMSSSRFLR